MHPIRTYIVLVMTVCLGVLVSATSYAGISPDSVECCEQLRMMLSTELSRINLSVQDILDQGKLTPSQVAALPEVIKKIVTRFPATDSAHLVEGESCDCQILKIIAQIVDEQKTDRRRYPFGYESFQDLVSLFVGVFGLMAAVLAVAGTEGRRVFVELSHQKLPIVRIRLWWVWCISIPGALVLTSLDLILRGFYGQIAPVTNAAFMFLYAIAFTIFILLSVYLIQEGWVPENSNPTGLAKEQSKPDQQGASNDAVPPS